MPTRPWLTAFLVFISFHLHLLCDLIGARGPDGDQWPIPYLKPFSNALQLTWHGQWALNAWQNFVITGLLLVATFWLAWKYGSSPAGAYLPVRQSGIDANAAAKVLIEDKTGGGLDRNSSNVRQKLRNL